MAKWSKTFSRRGRFLTRQLEQGRLECCVTRRNKKAPHDFVAGLSALRSRFFSTGDLSALAAADDGANRRERLVGVAAEGGDGADADHDNEGQHHGILNGRRAVLCLHKIHNELTKLTHDSFPFGSLAIRRAHKVAATDP